ncbi:MAG TPA: hypothetical protein VFS20_18035 [Longimicrobium sp.]|nr:hypothetical protein [Longimicrobium sp.]
MDERATISPLPNGTRIRLQPPLAFRWGCGLHAARFVFTRGTETMTLDLYGGPAQRSLRLEQPLPFRAGHFALDLSAPEARTDPASRLMPVPE